MINNTYLKTLKDLSNQIFNSKKKNSNFFLLISGPQGSGKTTFSSKIKNELEKKKLKVLVLSIDNFYLSKKDRGNISKKFSNLFMTRGVPGTHDLVNLEKILKIFRKNKRVNYKLPFFSKGHDDIIKSKFINLKFPYDVFILEGWCVGYKGVAMKKLTKPVNAMERELDKHLKWRKHVNLMSKKYYSKIYKNCDFSVFLKIPSFDQVFKWRKKQEQQIAKKLRMNDKQLKIFISFYQRITLDLLRDYKKSFKSYITINEKHNFGKLKNLR